MGDRGFEAPSRDAEGVERVRNEEGVPLPSRLRGLGSVVSSRSGVRGGAPAKKRISVLSKRHRTPVVETLVVLTCCGKTLLMEQDAQLSQRDRAAGCVIIFAKSRRLQLGDNILRTL